MESFPELPFAARIGEFEFCPPLVRSAVSSLVNGRYDHLALSAIDGDFLLGDAHVVHLEALYSQHIVIL